MSISSDVSERGYSPGGCVTEGLAHVQVVCIIAASNTAFLCIHVLGLIVFPVLASYYKSWSLLGYAGDALIILGLFSLGGVYVSEMFDLRCFAWVLFFIASLLTGVDNPWAPPLAVFTVTLHTLRRLQASHITVEVTHLVVCELLVPHLMLTAGLTFVLCGLLVVFGWLFICFRDSGIPTLQRVQGLVREFAQSQDAKAIFDYYHVDYARDCLQKGPSSNKLTEAVAGTYQSCAGAIDVIVITCAVPLATACLDIVLGVSFLLACRFCLQKSDTGSKVHWGRVSSAFFLVSTLLWVGLYLARKALDVSVSLTLLRPLLGLLLAAIVAAKCRHQHPGTLWGDDPMEAGVVLEAFVRVKDSTRFRAMAVGSFIVPTFMLLEQLRQKAQAPLSRLTHPRTWRTYGVFDFNSRAKFFYDSFQSWERTHILFGICMLGEMFFVLRVLGTKLTCVFMAWMIEVLTDQHLMYAMALAFIVGLLLLLLPPMPGAPAYVFCGFAVAKQGKEELPFAGKIGAAVMLCIVLKLLACTILYHVGACFGHWDSVRRLFGVGTPETTPIIHILNQKLSVSKVAVLVGGLDWPVSVTCGILGTHLGWMLVGTLPCLLTASPCVLAGAFLAGGGEGLGDKDEYLGTFFMLLAATVQIGLLLWASSAINAERTDMARIASTDPATYELVNNHSDGEQEADHDEELYQETIEWDMLSRPKQYILGTATCLILVTGYAFAIFGDVLFENFSFRGKIGDGLDEFGLGGNPLAIVKPTGWLAVFFCIAGMVLHLVFYVWTRHKARRRH